MSTSIFLQKMNRGIINLLRLGIWELDTAISRKVVGNKSRKVIWDMNSTLFPTLQLSNLLFLLFFSTPKHTFMTSRTILSNFFEEKWTQNRPTVPFGIVACTFSDNLSRNSCIPNYRRFHNFGPSGAWGKPGAPGLRARPGLFRNAPQKIIQSSKTLHIVATEKCPAKITSSSSLCLLFSTCLILI